MHHSPKIFTRFLLGSVLGLIGSSRLHAALAISEWSLTENSIEFVVSGSLDVDAPSGEQFPNVLYIGDARRLNTSWIVWESTMFGAFQSLAGDDELVYRVSATSDNDNGDWVSLRVDESAISILGPEDRFHIRASVERPNAFRPAAIEYQDLGIALGFDTDERPWFPDSEFLVGGALIPEPCGFWLLGASGLVLLAGRRRGQVA